MKNNPLLLICLISAITAIVTTVALKLFGFEGASVIAGGVAGGVAGAVAPILLKKK
ncbi:hypothetical protein N8Z75_02675 [Crocinitomicaceae bacterium]|nr:hypothetical protein [Crocinitomicaceae bacterium]MDC1266861.1 hypothetical protein [Crocinitomicaceae bacterium]